MRLKMHNGTARGDEDLCKTCSAAFRRRMANSNEQITQCRVMDQVVPGPVAECSGYTDASAVSIHAMQQIAWHISTDKKRNFAGFLNPQDAMEKAREGKLDLNLPGVDY